MASAGDLERARVRRTLRARLFGGEPEPLRLGRYRVVDRIATGGTSLVYLAVDETLDRQVALKLVADLNGDAARDSLLRQRMLREGRALARVSHPALVDVYDVGFEGDLGFLVVELVEGQTLADWLAEARDWRDVVERLLPVGEALAAAHAQGLVHRDVKPANVLLDAHDRSRLADFGFAHELREAPLEQSSPQLRLDPASTTTSVVGTPAYMAPEQWDGGQVDARTDQFAYCVTFFEALHGVRPFDAADLGSLRSAIDDGPPPLADSVPAWLDAVVRRGLAADPSERFDDMAALLDALRMQLRSLEHVEAAQIALARAAREPERRRELLALAARELDAVSVGDEVDAVRRELWSARFEDALSRDDHMEAAAMLDELDGSPDAALEARVAEARERAEAPQRRIAELERDRDPAVEADFKARSLLLSGFTWTLGYAIYVALDRFGVAVTPLLLVPFYLLECVATAGAAAVIPDKYAANAVALESTLASAATTGGHVLVALGFWFLGGSTATMLFVAHVYAAVMYGIIGLTSDRGAAWLTPTNVLGALAIVLWPEWVLEISVIVVPFGTLAWVRHARRSAAK